ncbi:MAG: hypothetical protein AUI36_46240 [Cyanobacteria bacterium 13_1_40CM_2_61_4]|nr:MAG: hypothetical protein AUI36_46240 [Cyanobacteria bacterium 13_1_40CM_2_61_4]
MTTVLFVHGTGTRKSRHLQIFTQIKESLKTVRSDVKVESCLWGEEYGAILRKNGASIPRYDTTRGPIYTEDEIALWGKLYEDPFYVLRGFAIGSTERAASVGRSHESIGLDRRVQMLMISPQLGATLTEAGIDANDFLSAKDIIVSSEAGIYDDAMLAASSSMDSLLMEIARAIVVQVMLEYRKRGKSASILADATVRDRVVLATILALGGKHPFRDALLKPLFKGIGSVWIEPQRGAITDGTYPFAGDILIYQSRGKQIRQFILSAIQKVQPPVVLLAHSLGGVACVDLLIEQQLNEQVPLLITVGSQAPFFYEIDALQSLEYPQPLPIYFPNWLNIYDQRDLLAFVGGSLFGAKVKDVPVDNRQPFPYTHSAYWSNEDAWKAIAERLP